MGPHDAGRKMQSLLAPVSPSVSVEATSSTDVASPWLASDLVGERAAGATDVASPWLESDLVGEREAGATDVASPWLESDLVGEREAGADLQRTVTQAFSLPSISGFRGWAGACASWD